MRVLHLPTNTASRASITVRAERMLGIDSYGIVFNTAAIQSTEGLDVVLVRNRRNPFAVAWGVLHIAYKLARYLMHGRPDIIHWYFNLPAFNSHLDWLIIRLINRPGLIEWTGVDIRIPEVEFAENPYYTAVFNNGYEYRDEESKEMSRRRQERYARLGIATSVMKGMEQYVMRDIVPHFYSVQQRLILSEFEPVYPNPENRKPLIVHGSTAPFAKGTAAVLRAIEQLKPRYDFEFKLIKGMTRAQALQLVQQADIVLDQFTWGDRGLAAVEAMAFGKPVVCYLKPSLVAAYPPENPIVNATQETLPDVLAALIEDGPRRRELGQRGRAYVEKHHDARKVAAQLLEIYEELCAQKHTAR